MDVTLYWQDCTSTSHVVVTTYNTYYIGFAYVVLHMLYTCIRTRYNVALPLTFVSWGFNGSDNICEKIQKHNESIHSALKQSGCAFVTPNVNERKGADGR